MIIVINLDFTNGTEVSLYEGEILLESGVSFATNCTNLFSTHNDCEVIVVKKNGEYISKRELLANSGMYTNKHIGPEHNIEKMLVANSFSFKPNVFLNIDFINFIDEVKDEHV